MPRHTLKTLKIVCPYNIIQTGCNWLLFLKKQKINIDCVAIANLF